MRWVYVFDHGDCRLLPRTLFPALSHNALSRSDNLRPGQERGFNISIAFDLARPWLILIVFSGL